MFVSGEPLQLIKLGLLFEYFTGITIKSLINLLKYLSYFESEVFETYFENRRYSWEKNVFIVQSPSL